MRRFLASFIAYSYRHNHLQFVQQTLRFTFVLQCNAPLPLMSEDISPQLR